jgi:hypothetical protein
MPKVIWKINLQDDNKIEVFNLPLGAKWLHVAEQNSKLAVWFECDPNNNTSQRKLFVALTNERFDQKAKHIGTVLRDHGNFVQHVYELREET